MARAHRFITLIFAVFAMISYAPLAVAADCNGNGIDDALDITRAASQDCNVNGIPDECDLSGVVFAPMTFYSIPLGAQFVRAADVDGDNDKDLVITGGQSSSTVSVLRNQGNGTFTGPETYTVPVGPNALAVGDLSGDGRPEIIVASGSGTSILPNLGDGTFGARVDYSTERTREVAAEDVDGDGDLDLVIVSWNYGYEIAKVRIWKNNGVGSFVQTVYSIGNSLGGLVVADLDGDHDLDIAVGDGKAACNCLHILLNSGVGTLTVAPDRVVDGVTYRLAGADLDDDGDVDLVLVKNSYNLMVLLNNGNATFTDTTGRGLEHLPYWLELGDLDRDGDVDFMTPSNQNLLLLLNRGNATLGADLKFNTYEPPHGSGPMGLAVADFNGDGWPDLASANANSNDVAIRLNVSVLPQSRDWNRNGTPDECETCVKTRDWDNDGDVDSDDFTAFNRCAAGASVPVASGCAAKDLDCDGDVDADDFGRFQRCFSGPHQPASPGCDG